MNVIISGISFTNLLWVSIFLNDINNISDIFMALLLILVRSLMTHYLQIATKLIFLKELMTLLMTLQNDILLFIIVTEHFMKDIHYEQPVVDKTVVIYNFYATILWTTLWVAIWVTLWIILWMTLCMAFWMAFLANLFLNSICWCKGKGFEMRTWILKKSKTGVSVAPQKRTYVLQNFKKKKLWNEISWNLVVNTVSDNLHDIVKDIATGIM